MSLNLKTIVSKFTLESRACLDDAIAMASREQRFEVDVEHLLLAWLSRQPTGAEQLCLAAGLRGDSLLQALRNCIKHSPAGNRDKPVLSTALVFLLEQAWIKASADWSSPNLPVGALLAGALLHRHEPELALSVNVREALNCDTVLADTLLRECDPHSASTPLTTSIQEQTDVLKRYTHNLSEQARKGLLDPVIGREEEVRQTIDVLLRRRQNNPVLTGEPGVGKTALVEGLAQRIHAGTVPKSLRHKEVLTLDLAQLQAGASVKGEFESRLEALLSAVREHPQGVILFIDEAHTLVGAGGASGQNDAANLLKPALARGEIRVIAATTRQEYRKYIEKDAALARRFQEVKVEAPDESRATAMLRAVSPAMAEYHQVEITESALVAAVRLSQRYLPDRQLPDKAVSLLDTACARVALSRCYQPHQMEDLQANLTRLEAEQKNLVQEGVSEERLTRLQAEYHKTERALAALQPHWEAQQALVTQISRSECLTEARRLRASLAECQQQHALVFERVDETCVADVLAGWTGIPVGRLAEKEQQQTEHLAARLAERVIGQDPALEKIATQVRIARAGLNDPDKPMGVFMLAGPSGVGKTETALALADLVFGGSQSLITINMSEYQEAHSVAGLKGSPPGYVGYGEGGVLTDAVRRRPYSVILLDEVEKAHPDVMELFYQVFDKGEMDDAEGRRINFRNTLILMTSNLGCEKIMQANERGERDVLMLETLIRPDFDRVFKPALMGRMSLIPYLSLDEAALASIVSLKLAATLARFNRASKGACLQHQPSVVGHIVRSCKVMQSGAREVDTVMKTQVLPLLAGFVSETESTRLLLSVSKKQLAVTRRR